MQTVKLANGGELQLSCTGDPVDLTREEIQQIDSLMGTVRAMQGRADRTETLTLNSGVLRVTFDGNWMDLNERGRALFGAISDLVTDYRKPVFALPTALDPERA